MSTDLARLVPDEHKRLSAPEVFKLGQVLYESRYFKDISSASQAIVKILRGQELGIGPIASLENINVIEGRTSLGAGLVGALIKKSGRYDYRQIESTDTAVELAFFEQGKEIGRSRFSLGDAVQAGLDRKQNWGKYPRAMLFARAMTQGARWYCPDVFEGGVYTPEELGGLDEPELAIDVPVGSPDAALPEEAPVPPSARSTAAPVVRSQARTNALVGGWQLLQQQAREFGLDVPDIDLTKSDKDLGAEHAVWLEKMQQRLQNPEQQEEHATAPQT